MNIYRKFIDVLFLVFGFKIAKNKIYNKKQKLDFFFCRIDRDYVNNRKAQILKTNYW